MSGANWTLVAAILGSSIVFLDSTVVNVALPRIGRELPSTLFGVLEGQSYVYNGYLLTLSALLILAGAINDYYGRRKTFAIGLVGFGLTSVLCGLAPSMELLVLFRVLQGAAGALLVPGSLALITTAFSGEAQGRAFGLWASASAGTTILGPFVGGILVDGVSWRAAFLINAPLVAFALWATLAHVKESRDEQASRQFDWAGAAVVAIAVGGLSFGTIYGQQREWRDPVAFAALAFGALATIAFPFLMARSPHPLVPLWLFRSRNFSVTNISTFLIYGALYVGSYYSTLFLQGTIGYTAAAAGLAGLPTVIFLTLFSSRVGALAGRYGPRMFMAVGPGIMALATLWYLRTPAASVPWAFRPDDRTTWFPPASYLIDFFPALLLYGIGLTIMVAPLTTALMTSVPPRNSGLASAINNAISRVGPQLAGALIFVAITANFYSVMQARMPEVDTSTPAFRTAYAPLNPPKEGQGGSAAISARLVDASREASTEAFHIAMLVSALLLTVGAAVNAAGIRNPESVPAAAPAEAVTAG